MIELKCHNCGAPLTKLPLTRTNKEEYKCEYCGSRYEGEYINNTIVYREILPSQCKTYASQERIPQFEYDLLKDDAKFQEIIQDRLAYSFLNIIKENLIIEEERDYCTGDYIQRAQLRIVPFNFKF